MKTRESRVCLEFNGQIYSVPESKAKEFLEILKNNDKNHTDKDKNDPFETEEMVDLYAE